LLVERNLSNDEIACRLGIKPGTVKIHIHNIFIKLDARDSELGPGPRRWSKTADGRKRISEAQQQRWQRWRAARSDDNT
jgi:DNA-binding NarL/FixJ family response regulator